MADLSQRWEPGPCCSLPYFRLLVCLREQAWASSCFTPEPRKLAPGLDDPASFACHGIHHAAAPEQCSTGPEEPEKRGGGLRTHRSPRISSPSPSWHFHLGKGSKREVLVPGLEEGAGGWS